MDESTANQIRAFARERLQEFLNYYPTRTDALSELVDAAITELKLTDRREDIKAVAKDVVYALPER